MRSEVEIRRDGKKHNGVLVGFGVSFQELGCGAVGHFTTGLVVLSTTGQIVSVRVRDIYMREGLNEI